MSETRHVMKGSLLDIVPIMVVICLFATTGIATMFILDTIENSTFNNTITSPYIEDSRAAVFVFNESFLFITVMMILATVIAAFYIKTHPIFFVAGLILSIVFVFLGAVLTNIFVEVFASTIFVTAANEMNYMVLVIQNLPLLVLFAIIVISIALYAKKRQESAIGI